MKEGKCCNCDPRIAALALGRWGLGVLFLFAGIGKFPDFVGFANKFVMPAFHKTWLPDWLVFPYAVALPFVEVALGALLLLGVARNAVIFTTGVLLLSLAFGEILLQQPATIFQNLIYLFVTAALLAGSKYDRWVVPCCNPKEPANGAAPNSPT